MPSYLRRSPKQQLPAQAQEAPDKQQRLEKAQEAIAPFQKDGKCPIKIGDDFKSINLSEVKIGFDNGKPYFQSQAGLDCPKQDLEAYIKSLDKQNADLEDHQPMVNIFRNDRKVFVELYKQKQHFDRDNLTQKKPLFTITLGQTEKKEDYIILGGQKDGNGKKYSLEIKGDEVSFTTLQGRQITSLPLEGDDMQAFKTEINEAAGRAAPAEASVAKGKSKGRGKGKGRGQGRMGKGDGKGARAAPWSRDAGDSVSQSNLAKDFVSKALDVTPLADGATNRDAMERVREILAGILDCNVDQLEEKYKAKNDVNHNFNLQSVFESKYPSLVGHMKLVEIETDRMAFELGDTKLIAFFNHGEDFKLTFVLTEREEPELLEVHNAERMDQVCNHRIISTINLLSEQLGLIKKPAPVPDRARAAGPGGLGDQLDDGNFWAVPAGAVGDGGEDDADTGPRPDGGKGEGKGKGNGASGPKYIDIFTLLSKTLADALGCEVSDLRTKYKQIKGNDRSFTLQKGLSDKRLLEEMSKQGIKVEGDTITFGNEDTFARAYFTHDPEPEFTFTVTEIGHAKLKLTNSFKHCHGDNTDNCPRHIAEAVSLFAQKMNGVDLSHYAAAARNVAPEATPSDEEKFKNINNNLQNIIKGFNDEDWNHLKKGASIYVMENGYATPLCFAIEGGKFYVRKHVQGEYKPLLIANFDSERNAHGELNFVESALTGIPYNLLSPVSQQGIQSLFSHSQDDLYKGCVAMDRVRAGIAKILGCQVSEIENTYRTTKELILPDGNSSTLENRVGHMARSQNGVDLDGYMAQENIQINGDVITFEDGGTTLKAELSLEGDKVVLQFSLLREGQESSILGTYTDGTLQVAAHEWIRNCPDDMVQKTESFLEKVKEVDFSTILLSPVGDRDDALARVDRAAGGVNVARAEASDASRGGLLNAGDGVHPTPPRRGVQFDGKEANVDVGCCGCFDWLTRLFGGGGWGTFSRTTDGYAGSTRDSQRDNPSLDGSSVGDDSPGQGRR